MYLQGLAATAYNTCTFVRPKGTHVHVQYSLESSSRESQSIFELTDPAESAEDPAYSRNMAGVEQ